MKKIVINNPDFRTSCAHRDHNLPGCDGGLFPDNRSSLNSSGLEASGFQQTKPFTSKNLLKAKSPGFLEEASPV